MPLASLEGGRGATNNRQNHIRAFQHQRLDQLINDCISTAFCPHHHLHRQVHRQVHRQAATANPPFVHVCAWACDRTIWRRRWRRRYRQGRQRTTERKDQTRPYVLRMYVLTSRILGSRSGLGSTRTGCFPR